MVGVVLMAYGSPADPPTSCAYYTDIRRGRPPTDEQLAELTRRYDGDRRPVAAARADRGAAPGGAGRARSAAPGQYRVVLGLKHSDPTIEAAVEELAGRA